MIVSEFVLVSLNRILENLFLFLFALLIYINLYNYFINNYMLSYHYYDKIK